VKISHRILSIIVTVLLVLPANSKAGRDRDIWILVDTEKMVLSVLEGNQVRRKYDAIAIGRAGTTLNKKMGDSKTPLGYFRLVRIEPSETFHRFLGINYPTVAHASRALRAGTISREHYLAIRQAASTDSVPPQETPLGGYIGIHGVGDGDPTIHKKYNWTQGCVALTNRQIDDLTKWVFLGMRVVIR
jgi:murein L,D-transpeptidase YafK